MISKTSSILAAVLLLSSASVTFCAETRQERLDRLRSYGFLITPNGIGDTDLRIVVPYDCRAGMSEVDDLLRFCERHSPRSEIVFFGPVIVEEDLRLFRQFLPQSLVRHMAAVGVGFVFRTTHDDRRSRVLRVDNVTASGKQLGLRVGDVIVGIGEFRWPEEHSHDFFQYAMKRQVPGQQTTVYIKRDGREIALEFKWGESGPSKHLTKSVGEPSDEPKSR